MFDNLTSAVLVRGVAKVPMIRVIKSVMPFTIAQITVLALLVIFPQIVTWPLQMMSR